MKLLTQEILKKAEKFPIGSQQNVKPLEQDVIVKFFNPYGSGTWIITEMSKEENGDYLMYGYCSLGYGYELGYVRFNELNELRVKVFGVPMPIERDMYIRKDCKVKDLISESDLM